MDPENIEILPFMEDLFEESLIINFNVTYKPLRRLMGGAGKNISPIAISAINDVVKCFLVKYLEHTTDLFVTLSRFGSLDIYVALLGQFYLSESEFSWSKLRKFLGIICSVVALSYVNYATYLKNELLNHIVAFLGCKLFGNPKKFIGWQAFEQNCADYVSKNRYTSIVDDLKHLGDLEQELLTMIHGFTYTTGMSGILRPGKADGASSAKAPSDPNDPCLQVRSCLRYNLSRVRTSNQPEQFMAGNVASEQSTIIRYEPVAGPSSASDVHIPQVSINNPVSSVIAGNVSYNEEQTLLNKNMPFDAEEPLTGEFVYSEVSELEYLVKLSLQTIGLIKNMQETCNIPYNKYACHV